MSYRRIAQLKTAADFRKHVDGLGIELPFDDQLESGPTSPLGQSIEADGLRAGNRFAILPMEGWDGTTDGKPTELTVRRWKRFGESGAKLIWGGEAVAVRHDGRANPNQLRLGEDTLPSLTALREALVKAHEERFGNSEDLVVGLQLTHSGRFARPNVKTRLEPRIAYRHPVLDPKFGIQEEAAVLSDDELDRLVEDFVAAAVRAQKAGFQFVDLKHCHGYLGHELLSARTRPGKYGGSLENRLRFLRSITEGIRAQAQGLRLGVRLSAFDAVPYAAAEDGTGVPDPLAGSPYEHGFGSDRSGTGINLDEPHAVLDALEDLGIHWVCVTAGSPYYNPHIQRPALFPPSDGYQPPEDPLVGVARQANVVKELKERHPQLVFVGSAYSYLQEWLPKVGQHLVRTGSVDLIGIGRLALSYPEVCADVLAGRPLQRKLICRTFSDCTTGPRKGLISGCFPLDPYYKAHPAAEQLAQLKRGPKDS